MLIRDPKFGVQLFRTFNRQRNPFLLVGIQGCTRDINHITGKLQSVRIHKAPLQPEFHVPMSA
jgi:hypothetical protein